MPEDQNNQNNQANPDQTQNSNDDGGQKPVSIDEYNKILEKNKNIEIALRNEREELKKYKDAEQQAEEKKKLEKGKHEEIINEQKKLIDELTKKANAYDELNTKIEQEKTNKLESILAGLSDEVKSKYAAIAEDLSLDKKIALYESISQEKKREDFTSKPKDEGDVKTTEFELLESKVKSGKATPTERSQYIIQLRGR